MRHREAMRAVDAPLVAEPLPDAEYTLLVTFPGATAAGCRRRSGAPATASASSFSTEDGPPKLRRLRNRPEVPRVRALRRSRQAGGLRAAASQRVLAADEEAAAERALNREVRTLKRRVYERVVPSGPPTGLRGGPPGHRGTAVTPVPAAGRQRPELVHPIGVVESPLTDPATAPKQGTEGAPPRAWLVFEPSVLDGLREIRPGDRMLGLDVAGFVRAATSCACTPSSTRPRPSAACLSTRSAERP